MAKKSKTQPVNETSELILAIDELCKAKNISREVLFTKIEAAMVSAYKKEYGKQDNVTATVNRTTGTIEVFARKTGQERSTRYLSPNLALARSLSSSASSGVFSMNIALYTGGAQSLTELSGVPSPFLQTEFKQDECHRWVSKLISGSMRDR